MWKLSSIRFTGLGENTVSTFLLHLHWGSSSSSHSISILHKGSSSSTFRQHLVYSPRGARLWPIYGYSFFVQGPPQCPGLCLQPSSRFGMFAAATPISSSKYFFESKIFLEKTLYTSTTKWSIFCCIQVYVGIVAKSGFLQKCIYTNIGSWHKFHVLWDWVKNCMVWHVDVHVKIHCLYYDHLQEVFGSFYNRNLSSLSMLGCEKIDVNPSCYAQECNGVFSVVSS